MDFMKCALVTIHVPTRMVLMGVNLPYPDELDEDDMDGHCTVGNAVILLDASAPTFLEKAEHTNLGSNLSNLHLIHTKEANIYVEAQLLALSRTGPT